MTNRGATRATALVAGVAVTAVALLVVLQSPEPWTLRGDNSRVVLPMTVEAHRAVLAGRIPEWSSSFWDGFPLLAEVNAAALYLPHHVVLALSPLGDVHSYDVAFALHAGWLMAGTTHLALLLGTSRTAALVSGASLVLYPLGIWWGAGMLMTFAAFSWWPWACVGAELLARPAPSRWCWIGAWLAISGPVYAGYPEFALYGGGLATAWLITRTSDVPLGARCLRAVLLGAGGLALAAPQLLATALYAMDTARGQAELAGAAINSLGSRRIGFLDPWAVFVPGAAPAPSFIGLTTVVLAACGVLFGGRRRFFLAGVVVVAVALALGDESPIYRVVRSIPPFTLFRLPVKFLFPMALGLALLAGLGLDAALRGTRAARVGGVMLAVVMIAERGADLAYRARAGAWPGGHTSAMATLRTLRDAGLPRPERSGAVASRLAEEPSGAASNLPSLLGIHTVTGGPVALLPARTRMLRKTAGIPLLQDAAWVLGSGRACAAWPQSRRADDTVSGDDWCLWSVRNVRPRVELVGALRAVASEDAMLDVVRSLRDLPNVVPVRATAAEAAAWTGTPRTGDRVRVLAYEPGRIELDVRLATPRLVLVRESWARGWSASVDGRPGEVRHAAGLFLGVPVGRGRHRVVLRFRAPGLRLGIALGGAWLLAAGIFSTVRTRRT